MHWHHERKVSMPNTERDSFWMDDSLLLSFGRRPVARSCRFICSYIALTAPLRTSSIDFISPIDYSSDADATSPIDYSSDDDAFSLL
jgi:hypothetical protein